MSRTLFRYFFLATTLLVTLTLSSCQPKYVSDYDYRKAEEAYQNDDYDEAMSLVEKQLKATPKNVDAFYLRALIYTETGEYAKARADVDRALKYYRGEPEVERSRLCALKGLLFQTDDLYPDAAKAFTRAVKFARKDDPDHVQDIRFLLAQNYYKMEDRSAANKVFLEMLEEDPENRAAMIGMARNRMDEEQYASALEWLEKAQKIDEEYADVYKFKMQVLDKMGEREASIEAALKYFELDDDASVGAVTNYCGKYYSFAVAKVNSRMNYADDPTRWQVLLTSLYEDHGDYRSAIALYDQLLKAFDDDEDLLYYRSNCYRELGEFRRAADDLTQAYEQTNELFYLCARGDALRSGGFYDEAIRDYKVCLEKDPAHGYYYYAIGWSYELSGDAHQAILCYDEGIKIDPNYAYLFQSRADLLLPVHPDEARADYEKVLELDTIPEDGSCRHYALWGLGREAEALEWIDRIIAATPNESGNWYDKACLYARMGKLDESLAALDTAFQKGFRRFAHMEHDDDMDPVRNLPEYKELVDKYKIIVDHPQLDVTLPADDSSTVQPERGDSLVSEIPMRRKPGGTYEVPCTINGLPLKFIFDTGASDVSISSVEADFMLKNNYLKERDFRGTRKYLTADGTICDGAIICLREVKVGDVSLKNIEAAVVKNQQAPLLLGQSALERLGRITIDNESSKLIISQK